MNKELLLIDLLAEKKEIEKVFNSSLKNRIWALCLTVSMTSLLFFGIGKFFQQFLLAQTNNIFYVNKINHLYQFSRGLGYFFLLVFSICLILYIINYIQFKNYFHQWLKNKIETIDDWNLLEQDSYYYYFFNNQDIKEQPTKRSLSKKSIKKINLSENEGTLIIGQSRSFFYLYRIYFLIKPEKEISKIPTKENKLQKKAVQGIFFISLFGLMISYFYLTSSINTNQINEIKDSFTYVESNTTIDIQNGDNLIASNEIEINHHSDTEMSYYFDNEHDLFFQTTDYGETWQEVPINASDTRRGDYTLTTGAVPAGYFMDHTYDISPEFSWYLYSPPPKEDERLDLNFLTSTDNGKTWTSYFIGEVFDRVRYRKVQPLKNGLTLAFTSTPTTMSEELFTMYSSTDNGQSWTEWANTTLSSPLQNTSFISQSTGFLATREKLFYTSNGGISFDEALINLPSGYSSKGLDIFTSPNEVTQKSANTLSIRLNLVKTKDVDIGKLFECEFTSTDNGATWNFEKQIKEIRQ